MIIIFVGSEFPLTWMHVSQSKLNEFSVDIKGLLSVKTYFMISKVSSNDTLAHYTIKANVIFLQVQARK
jgi:hypothetical protein